MPGSEPHLGPDDDLTRDAGCRRPSEERRRHHPAEILRVDEIEDVVRPREHLETENVIGLSRLRSAWPSGYLGGRRQEACACARRFTGASLADVQKPCH